MARLKIETNSENTELEWKNVIKNSNIVDQKKSWKVSVKKYCNKMFLNI